MKFSAENLLKLLHERFVWWNERFITIGQLAFAFFWLAVFSGIPLLYIYFDDNPVDSLQLLLLGNPIGMFFRSLHYWAGQIFLFLTMIHIFEHFYKSTEREVRFSIWIKLVFLIPVVLYIMLSGYILKGDQEGELARNILAGLINLIPLLGGAIKTVLLGRDESFSILYLNHIATATILSFVIIWEHFRRVWPTVNSWLSAVIISCVLSFFLSPTIHDGSSFIAKGPWYMLPVQELLHQIPYPLVVVILLISLATLTVFIPKLSLKMGSRVKVFLTVIFAIYLLMVPFGIFFRGENWELVSPLKVEQNSFRSFWVYFSCKGVGDSPKLLMYKDRREGCLACHFDVTGFSKSHDPTVIGCSGCHLGDRMTLNGKEAHKGMILVPGNLQEAKKTCGTEKCHSEIVERVKGSLMATGRGLVSVNRYVFGEAKTPNGEDSLEDLASSDSDSYLEQLCYRCHLNYEKKLPAKISEESRGGGCLACHLNYSDKSYKKDRVHPKLNIEASSNHCFGCHSRSTRISTNYEGWHETDIDSDDVGELPSPENYRTLEDGRVFKMVREDVHHKRGLECIDCHSSRDTMGDGKKHLHQEEQVETSCEDCHSNKPKLASWKELGYEARKISLLRHEREFKNRKFVKNIKGIPYENVYIEKSGKIVLEGKLSKKKYFPLSPNSKCAYPANSHERVTCSACHTSWAPQCISCHVGKRVGKWREYADDFLSDAPTLGVYKNKIVTFIPGMVMTLNRTNIGKSSSKKLSQAKKEGEFIRLFSPVSPHTTSKSGRSCKSCHNSGNAIGIGRGSLKLDGNYSKWKFTPKFKLLRDGLPADGWTWFLGDTKRDKISTRVDARPFNRSEQIEVLTVGHCLTCHQESEYKIFDNFKEALKKMKPSCY